MGQPRRYNKQHVFPCACVTSDLDSQKSSLITSHNPIQQIASIACRLLPLPFRMREDGGRIASPGEGGTLQTVYKWVLLLESYSAPIQCRICLECLLSFSAVSSATSLRWQPQQHLTRRLRVSTHSLPVCSAVMSPQSKHSVRRLHQLISY